MDIWQFNNAVMRWLVRWNIPNILIGALLARSDQPVVRGFASQNVGWGVVNLGIAFLGGRVTQRRREKLADPNAPEVLARETRNMRRLLLVNAGLDLLYVLGGWRLAATRGQSDARMRGAGYGIMLQGALLFVWDAVLVLMMPRRSE